MSIWELGKPVIAQVHGYCLAGGSELATCCDLVYMADDAQMGYPAVRFGVPTTTSTPGSSACARRWR
jgi:enoyl-CoA hydratase